MAVRHTPPPCSQPQTARSTCREKTQRSRRCHILTMTRTVMAVRHTPPPCSQPQKACTTCREKTQRSTWCLYINYDTYSSGCQTYANTMQPATEHTHHLRRESRDRNGAINSRINMRQLRLSDTLSCSLQPQEASTTCRDREIGQHFAYLAKYGLLDNSNHHATSHRKHAQPAETEIGQDFTSEAVALVEFMYLVFTRMPGETYRRCVCVAVLVLRILSANQLPCLLIADFAYLAKYYTCPGCWTLRRPSCNQPQKARTSYWKLELENYKDCSLVSVKTCLALSLC